MNTLQTLGRIFEEACEDPAYRDLLVSTLSIRPDGLAESKTFEGRTDV